MTYLFAAFAVVWVGLFLYLYGLVRRSRGLERELDALAARSRSTPLGGTRPR
jgi:CcmD family protein